MPPETIKKQGEPSLPSNTQNFRSDFNIYFLISKGEYRFLCSLNLFFRFIIAHEKINSLAASAVIFD